MKDEEFLAKARTDRAALIVELEDRKTWQRFGTWVACGILFLNMVVAMFTDRRWVDYGPLFEGVVTAVFAAHWLYYDALIKALKLDHAR